MFSGISKYIQGVFHTDIDNLRIAWNNIQDEHKKLLDAEEGIDDPALLHRTSLHEHLHTVIAALVNEEKKGGKRLRNGQTEGPCFEFVIREEIIEHLCTLGLPDRPPGMRLLMIASLDEFFRNVNKPLLTHGNIHRAIRNFIMVCVDRGDLSGRETRTRLISLLKTLCLRLRDNPSLSSVFFEEYRQTTQQPEFIIFTTLLSLLNDDDVNADVAIEGILCCVQLPEERIARYIMDQTDFSAQLLLGLGKLYESLPPTCTNSKNDDDMFNDVIPRTEERKFRKFWLRLQLVDVIVQSTLPILSKQICEHMLEFLSTRVRPQLLHVNEATSKWATVYVRTMLERIESTRLRRCICEFLLNKGEEWSPRRALLTRTRSLNEDTLVATLGLVETLLSFHDEWIVSNLVLEGLERAQHESDREFVCVPREQLTSLFSNVDKYIADDPGFEGYRLDAQEGVQKWFSSFDTWTLPQTIQTIRHDGDDGDDDDDDSNPKSELQYTDGVDNDDDSLLLSCVFHRLELCFQNSFRVNLRLTSVLAELLYCPHPVVHAFLLDPKLPPTQNLRSLLHILSDLWNKGLKFAADMPEFPTRLQQVRRRLDGSDISLSRTESQDEERMLQAMVVLEEFVKELVAINEAKNRFLDVSNKCESLQSLPVPGLIVDKL